MTVPGEEAYDLSLLSVGGFRPGCDGGSLAALDLLSELQSRGMRVCALCLYPADEWAAAVRIIEGWFSCSLVPRGSAAATGEPSRGRLHEAEGCELPLLAAPLSGCREQVRRSPTSLLPEILGHLREVPMRAAFTADSDEPALLAAFFERIPGLHLFNSLANIRVVANLGHGALRLLATRRLFTVSEFLREQIQDRLSLDASVIHPVWRLEDYRAGGKKGLTGFVGFYAGGVPRAKGDEIVLEAARQLPSIRFLVVGKALYRGNQSLPSNIVELGRLRDMCDFYSQIDLLIVPSIEPEGFPRVVVEAAFNGIPSIASRAGGLPEAVGDGGVLLEIAATDEGGVLCSGRSLAEVIRFLLGSPARLVALGDSARSGANRLRRLQARRLVEVVRLVSWRSPAR